MTQPGALLLDLEGTLYQHGSPLPSAADTVRSLRGLGWRVRFLTNVDSRPPAAVADELTGIGLDVPVADLFTPVSAAKVLFAADTGARVLPLVSTVLRPEFAAPDNTEAYTHVLVGDCRDVLDYPALDRAFRAIRGGAELVALHRGRYFKRPDGDHLDTGAVVAALEYAAGVRARVLGKPSADFFQLAAASLGCGPADCVVVGDDATTDIAGGRAVGARTVQVRTGKYADQTAEGLAGGADATIDSIADLPALLAGDAL
ncbi:HAD-IIA family hydrolase [Nocardia sp. NPDC051570]|uniref:HAD-IIA family hydrolase n=1 Tax=Nocardia sp. NPDC051570 TaxID=3364324 RepID=UPI003799D584